MPCEEWSNGEHLRWRWTSPLGTCIYNTYDEIAICFGVASMLIWTFALLPQIILNYQNGSAENQSMYFWLLWIIGDILNFTGCILANEIITNTGLAAVYLLFTVVCFGQFVYYNIAKADNSTRKKALTGGGFGSPVVQGTRQASPAFGALKGSPLRRRHYGAVAMAGTTLLTLLAQSEPLAPRRRLGASDATGQVFGYGMAAIYICSRLPQIWLMAKTYCVDGISPTFFFLTFMGNLTQFCSMTVKESVSLHYVIFNLPWLLSASVCAVEDLLVLYLYRKITQKDQHRELDKDEEEVRLLGGAASAV